MWLNHICHKGQFSYKCIGNDVVNIKIGHKILYVAFNLFNHFQTFPRPNSGVNLLHKSDFKFTGLIRSKICNLNILGLPDILCQKLQ